jgi:hypothetical protein
LLPACVLRSLQLAGAHLAVLFAAAKQYRRLVGVAPGVGRARLSSLEVRQRTATFGLAAALFRLATVQFLLATVAPDGWRNR